MSYQRVLPRDLFNEAKLLKCLGRMALLINDEMTGGFKLELKHYTVKSPGFIIDQNPDAGSFYCKNLKLMLGDKEIPLSTALNSRQSYPMYFTDDRGEECCVFDEAGCLAAEFLAMLRRLSP